jgi:type IV secretory pathway component VirB8
MNTLPSNTGKFFVVALMMEAARTSETSVDNYFTRQYIPEDESELHTRRRENLKSHIIWCKPGPNWI